MSATGATVLLKGREYLSVVEHVPGRIELRFSPWILFAVEELRNEEGRAALAQLDGILGVDLNLGAFTIAIDYDPERIPEGDWGTVLDGPEEEARAILERLLPPA